MFKKILLINIIMFYSVSFADNVQTQLAKEAVMNDFIDVTNIKQLENGGSSILLSFLGKTCRVDIDKNNIVLNTECDDNSDKEIVAELKRVYFNLQEDTLIRGYCDFKLKQSKSSKGVLNRCQYAQYVVLSQCAEEETCMDYSQWLIQKKHNKIK